MEGFVYYFTFIVMNLVCLNSLKYELPCWPTMKCGVRTWNEFIIEVDMIDG